MKTVGIIGINGMVGQKMLAELQKVKQPFEIKTFGRNDEIPALDIAVLCTDNPVSRELAPALKNRVKFIVDMSSEFRMTDGVPLVIPEINPHAITKDTPLIASPNCTTTGLVMSSAAAVKNYWMISIRPVRITKKIAYRLSAHYSPTDTRARN